MGKRGRSSQWLEIIAQISVSHRATVRVAATPTRNRPSRRIPDPRPNRAARAQGFRDGLPGGVIEFTWRRDRVRGAVRHQVAGAEGVGRTGIAHELVGLQRGAVEAVVARARRAIRRGVRARWARRNCCRTGVSEKSRAFINKAHEIQ